MNIATIMTELTSVKNAKLTSMGVTETQSLSQTQLDEFTDAIASKLETVNPTTTYPPTGR